MSPTPRALPADAASPSTLMTVEASPPRPDPSNRRRRTRQALLDAAGELFSKQGVERTTVEEIADLANLSVGSIYKHFANKEALAVAFIDESLAIGEQYLAEARDVEQPLDRILGAGDAYFRFARDHSAACRFATMRALDPSSDAATHPIDQAMAKRTQNILLAVAADLKATMDAGIVRRMPVDEAMVFLWGAWSGVAHLVIRQDPIQIPPELAERALALGRTILLDALCAPGARPAG